MTRKRLESLIGKLEPAMARRFRQVMQRARSRSTVAKLEAAIESEGVGVVAKVLDDIEAAAGALASTTATANATTGTAAAAFISEKTGALVSYDATNPRAVAALQRHRAMLVQAITEEQRQALITVLQDGLQRGANPRQTAIAIRDVIGLTDYDGKIIANYRRALEAGDRHALTYALRDKRSDGAVLRAVEAGQPLPQKRIDRLVERYAEGRLRRRSEVVAHEETMRALEQAQDEAYQQAIEGGNLDVDRLQLEWNQRSRPSMRDSHRSLHGQKRRHGEVFVSGNGNHLRHPHDPDAPASENLGCGCWVRRRILPVGQVAIGGDEASA